MKLEFLDDISRGGFFKDVVSNALVRLFDFDAYEAGLFQQTIKKLIDDEIEVHLDRLPFIDPINCSLTLSIGDSDLGIVKSGKKEFECKLTKDSYREMVSLLQPFVAKDSDGYQWLCNNMADIDFLFSPGGTW
jgi:hypothetical protein